MKKCNFIGNDDRGYRDESLPQQAIGQLQNQVTTIDCFVCFQDGYLLIFHVLQFHALQFWWSVIFLSVIFSQTDERTSRKRYAVK